MNRLLGMRIEGLSGFARGRHCCLADTFLVYFVSDMTAEIRLILSRSFKRRLFAISSVSFAVKRFYWIVDQNMSAFKSEHMEIIGS